MVFEGKIDMERGFPDATKASLNLRDGEPFTCGEGSGKTPTGHGQAVTGHGQAVTTAERR